MLDVGEQHDLRSEWLSKAQPCFRLLSRFGGIPSRCQALRTSPLVVIPTQQPIEELTVKPHVLNKFHGGLCESCSAFFGRRGDSKIRGPGVASDG